VNRAVRAATEVRDLGAVLADAVTPGLCPALAPLVPVNRK
jgi:hypothetical protein